MRLSKKYGGLQFFAPSAIRIYVNGEMVILAYKDGSAYWSENASLNPKAYSIDSNNQVVWENSEFLAYNDVIVLGSDFIVANGNYTTIGGGFNYE